jgi:hypothetical protein
MTSDDVDLTEALAHSVPGHDRGDAACRSIAPAPHYARLRIGAFNQSAGPASGCSN